MSMQRPPSSPIGTTTPDATSPITRLAHFLIYLLFFLSPLSSYYYQIMSVAIHRYLLLASIIMGLTLLFLLSIGQNRHQWRFIITTFRPHFPILGLLLALLLLSCLSITVVPWGAPLVRSISIILSLGATVAVIISVFWFRPKWRGIQVAIGASLMMQSLIALRQFAFQRSLGLQILGEATYIAAPGNPILFAGDTYILRATGLVNNPNSLAAFLLTGAFLFIVPEWNRRSRIVHFLVLSLTLASAFVTYSRSGWLGYTLSLVLLTAVSRLSPSAIDNLRRQIGVAWLVTIVVIGSGFFMSRNVITSRTNPDSNRYETRSVSQRIHQYPYALRTIRDHPFFGVGIGNSSHFARQTLTDAQIDEISATIHNIPLLIAAEIGIAGGVIWIAVLLLPLCYLWKPKTRNGLALTGALVCFLFIDMFVLFSWRSVGGFLYHWMLIGMWSLENRSVDIAPSVNL